MGKYLYICIAIFFLGQHSASQFTLLVISHVPVISKFPHWSPGSALNQTWYFPIFCCLLRFWLLAKCKCNENFFLQHRLWRTHLETKVLDRDHALVRKMKFSLWVFPKTVNAQMFWQMSCLLRTADLKLRFPSGLINCPSNVPFSSQFTKEMKMFLQKKEYCCAKNTIRDGGSTAL